jgi:hypothetical protein
MSDLWNVEQDLDECPVCGTPVEDQPAAQRTDPWVPPTGLEDRRVPLWEPGTLGSLTLYGGCCILVLVTFALVAWVVGPPGAGVAVLAEAFAILQLSPLRILATPRRRRP